MELLVSILAIIAFLLSFTGFYFFYKIPFCSLNNRKKYPSISIIIPARNEEKNISILLKSINNQTFKIDEVLVVNDHSTDKTKDISEKLGAKVIDAADLPADWKGKSWACFQGANQSMGDILIFLDSDTEFEKDGLQKLVDTFLNLENKSAMSVAPYHKVQKLYEEFSSVFNVVMMGAMNAFTPYKNNIADGLFGQSLILDRDTYFNIGGHEVVKDKVLENVYMAQHLKNQGIVIKCFGGKDTLSFRMYSDGLIDLINGWTKAFASGASRTSFSVLIQIILWLNSGFISIILLFYSFNIFTVSLYLFLVIQFYWMLKRIGSFRVSTAMFFPIYYIFYFLVFSKSLYNMKTNKKTNWKERAV